MEPITETSDDGYRMYRTRVCYASPDADCIHNLPDSVYAVSSYEDVDHEAYRARIDNYFTLIQSCLRMASRPCKRRQSMAGYHSTYRVLDKRNYHQKAM